MFGMFGHKLMSEAEINKERRKLWIIEFENPW